MFPQDARALLCCVIVEHVLLCNRRIFSPIYYSICMSFGMMRVLFCVWLSNMFSFVMEEHFLLVDNRTCSLRCMCDGILRALLCVAVEHVLFCN